MRRDDSESYLHGIPFKIVTDCNSLTLAMKKKEINPRIERWVMELQNFDYVTEHRAGTRMTHVDGLSRCNWVGVISDNPFETNLMCAQNKDERIIEIRKRLEKNEDKLYESRNGVIYRKSENGDTFLFYVPSIMEKNVIFKYHDDLGHQGIAKVYDTMHRSYWFPEMRKKIAKHVKNCCKCIAFSPMSGKVEGMVNAFLRETL